MSKHDDFIHGEIGDDGSHPNSPNHIDPPSVLRCQNETGTWIAENMAEVIQTGAIEIIGDWLAGPRDGYAETKLHRELMELAEKCERQILDTEERDRRNAE